MRVLTSGRTAVVLAVTACVAALALPASAGVTAHAGTPAGELATRTSLDAGAGGSTHPPAPGHRGTSKVVLGTAVAYVREPDGTVRRYR
jgi:hypothetical protein